MIFKRRFFALFLLFVLGGCSALQWPPAATPLPSETPLMLPQVTDTPTIVWFPASPTPSPQAFATYTGTPEMRPDVGQVTVNDPFTDEGLWDTAASDQGSASIGRNRLTLAVQPDMYMISLRHKLSLGDFYAEITARPNLCRGDDDYGVLIRANAVAYYRFALSCNGMVRAERISIGTRQVLQAPVLSGDAPRGSPGEVRIGVWAGGPSMRLFLNGRYQFTVNSPNYPSGTIGVFAHSAGDTPVTVNFSDLVIQSVTYTPPTRTPKP